MRNSIWIISVFILIVIFVFWVFMQERIQEDIDDAGVEVIENVTPQQQ